MNTTAQVASEIKRLAYLYFSDMDLKLESDSTSIQIKVFGGNTVIDLQLFVDDDTARFVSTANISLKDLTDDQMMQVFARAASFNRELIARGDDLTIPMAA